MEVKKYLKSQELLDFASATFSYTLVTAVNCTFQITNMITTRYMIPQSNLRKIFREIILTKLFWQDVSQSVGRSMPMSACFGIKFALFEYLTEVRKAEPITASIFSSTVSLFALDLIHYCNEPKIQYVYRIQNQQPFLRDFPLNFTRYCLRLGLAFGVYKYLRRQEGDALSSL